MKKNENGFPCFDNTASPCFNSPRANTQIGESGVEDMRNRDHDGNTTARPREGCSGGNAGNADGRPREGCSGGNVGNTTARPREGCSGGNVGNAGGRRGNTVAMNGCDEVPLAYVYAPEQKFCMLYSAEEALKHGTLFENLYKPMGVYGRE